MGAREPLKDATCPNCGKIGHISRFSRRETVNVRGMDFQIEKVLRACAACGAEFENTKDDDWRVEAYAAYRAAKGMVQPERIRAWRKEYSLTQAEVTALLGWGEVTLGRYENGSLQTEAHDRRLAEIMEPGNLAAALSANPEALSEDRRNAVLTAIREHQGLLAPADLRSIRLKYGLSEGEMDRLIAVRPGTVARWEDGAELQGKAADTLLREMAEQPDVVRSLLGKCGIESPAARRALHRIDEDVERRVAAAIYRQFGDLGGLDIDKLVQVATEEFRKAQAEAATHIGAAA